MAGSPPTGSPLGAMSCLPRCSARVLVCDGHVLQPHPISNPARIEHRRADGAGGRGPGARRAVMPPAIVAVAEAAELVTAVVRRSPASLTRAARVRGGRDAGMAGLLAGARHRPADRAHRRHRRSPDRSESLAGFLRPLGGPGKLVGHFHAMAFPYRPVPQRTVSLRALVEKLLETQPLTDGRARGVRRPRVRTAPATTRSLRGLCWTGPITSVAAWT